MTGPDCITIYGTNVLCLYYTHLVVVLVVYYMCSVVTYVHVIRQEVVRDDIVDVI
jgi:hypothetical protein